MVKKQVEKQPKLQSEKLKDVVVFGMQEKKAQNITVLDLRHVHHAVADFFIICTGGSDTQIAAVLDSIEEQVYKQLGQFPYAKEAAANMSRGWVLLDYIDVVAHVFQKERRNFYALEELWGDAVITQLQ